MQFSISNIKNLEKFFLQSASCARKRLKLAQSHLLSKNGFLSLWLPFSVTLPLLMTKIIYQSIFLVKVYMLTKFLLEIRIAKVKLDWLYLERFTLAILISMSPYMSEYGLGVL